MIHVSSQLSYLIRHQPELTIEQLKVLNDLRSFMARFEYPQSSKRTREVIGQYWLGLNDEQISSVLGVKYTTVRILRQQGMKSVFNLLGVDFLTKLRSGSPQELAECQMILTSFLEPLNIVLCSTMYSVLTRHTSRPPSDFRLTPAHKEALMTLKQYSVKFINEWVDSQDPDFISYVSQLLKGTGGDPADRVGLVNMLTK